MVPNDDDTCNERCRWWLQQRLGMGGLEACICLEPMVCFFLLIFLLTLFIYLDYHPHGTQRRRMGGDRIIQWTINEYIFFVCSFSCFFFFYFTIDCLCIGTERKDRTRATINPWKPSRSLSCSTKTQLCLGGPFLQDDEGKIRKKVRSSFQHYIHMY